MSEVIPKPESESRAESEAEKEPRRVFIEIGARNAPFSFWGERKLGENEIYIGIDIDEESVVSAKNLTEHCPGEMGKSHHYFVRGDAKNIPLADSSADEVFMGNILGDEMHISQEDRKKFLLEASRLLNKNGRLIIKETATPLSYEQLSQLLQGTGFVLDRGWSKESKPEEFETQRRLYEGKINLSAQDSYIVVLKKGGDQDTAR